MSTDKPRRPPRELLTASEVALIFRVDAKTVGRWARQGRLPHLVTPGGHRRFHTDAIERIVAENEYLFADEPDCAPAH